jgi:hypothetical protein
VEAVGESTWGRRIGISHFVFITCIQLWKLDVLPDILDISNTFILFAIKPFVFIFFFIHLAAKYESTVSFSGY